MRKPFRGVERCSRARQGGDRLRRDFYGALDFPFGVFESDPPCRTIGTPVERSQLAHVGHRVTRSFSPQEIANGIGDVALHDSVESQRHAGCKGDA